MSLNETPLAQTTQGGLGQIQSPNASYISNLKRQSRELKEKAEKIDTLLTLLHDNPETQEILELITSLGGGGY